MNNYKNINEKTVLENIFEIFLWKSRLAVIIAVIPSILASLSLFFIGTHKILKVFLQTFGSFMNYEKGFYKYAVMDVVTAVDIYLIATVMIIFGLGLYELYVSKLDPAEHSEIIKILKIKSLDDLKGKLGKVILMVLIVTFFKYALQIPYHNPQELLILSISILSISGAIFLSARH
ncbi:YqhA family protein [Desulfurobacterium sp.]